MHLSVARFATLLLAILLLSSVSHSAERRTWSDSTGRFSIEAEMLDARDGKVRLRREDGKVVTVVIDQLSSEDQQFIATAMSEGPVADPKESAPGLTRLAQQFFTALRSTDRAEARELLTEAGQELAEGTAQQSKSPLFQLPAPDEGARSVRVSRPKVSGRHAEIPVQVRVGGELQKTMLHCRIEEEEWRVFGLSATVGDQVRTVDFESPPPEPGQYVTVDSLVGKPIELHGVTLDGGQLDMSRYAGKVVLVDFWATWCGPCRAEMPNILANWQQYHQQGFEVIAVSVDDDLTDLRNFVARQSPPWAVVVDRHSRNPLPLQQKYNVQSLPTLVLVDRDGTVAAVNCRGPRLAEELAKLFANNQPGEQPANEPNVN